MKPVAGFNFKSNHYVMMKCIQAQHTKHTNDYEIRTIMQYYRFRKRMKAHYTVKYTRASLNQGCVIVKLPTILFETKHARVSPDRWIFNDQESPAFLFAIMANVRVAN